MMLYSRQARGGKTTTLLKLFDTLKLKGVNVMFISFSESSGYKRLQDETDEQALFRVIAKQFINQTTYEGKIAVDWQQLDAHIGSDPFILLIDDINQLSIPLEVEVASALRNYFLNKAGRYLVVSGHTEVIIDTNVIYTMRPCHVVALPVSNDIAQLQSMGTHCKDFSPHLVAYYGCIPSLLYSHYETKDYSPQDRFDSYDWTYYGQNSDVIFGKFIVEILTGRRSHPEIREFDKLGSLTLTNDGVETHQVMQWPPCYIDCILDLFHDPRGLRELKDALKALKFYHTKSLPEMWWTELITIAILLRFIESSYTGEEGPFGVCDVIQADGAAIKVVKLSLQHKTPENARSEMEAELSIPSEQGILILFSPTNEKFEQFDGFVGFTKNGKWSLIGYQCEYGDESFQLYKPAWLSKAIHIRGSPPQKNNMRGREYEYWNTDKIKNFLGCSIGALYPDNI